MRVAYVCLDPGAPVFGGKGCSVHVQEIVRAFGRRGAQVELFASRLGGSPPGDLERVGVHRLSPLPEGATAERELASLGHNVELQERLRAAGRFDLIYERYSLFGYAAMEWARRHGVPGVLEVNAPLIEEQATHRRLHHRVAAERVASRAFAAATAIVAVSEGVADFVRRHPGTDKRVHVIPNGVDLARFAPSRSNSPAGTLTIGFVGTLKPWHGLDILVRAFERVRRRHPDTRLLIVGDGPERARLEAWLAAAGLGEATVFTGAVRPDEVPGLLASMDVAVAPYPPLDGFYFSPLKVYEYLAAGVPVVASRIGQIVGLIDDGVNGLLCPPGEVGALAGSIEALLGRPDLRTRLGRAGRQSVARDHGWDAVLERILGLTTALGSGVAR